MNIEELKRQRNLRQWQIQTSARCIGDVYKDVKTIKVSILSTFRSAVSPTPYVKEWNHCMKPSDSLYLYHECINKCCTSDGFDLTGALRNALSSRTCVEGEMYCAGKEDWKYLKSSGCSCSTVLKYIIEPMFY